jgi:hypothetical protein
MYCPGFGLRSQGGLLALRMCSFRNKVSIEGLLKMGSRDLSISTSSGLRDIREVQRHTEDQSSTVLRIACEGIAVAETVLIWLIITAPARYGSPVR